MTVDVWKQHPAVRFIADDVLASLRAPPVVRPGEKLRRREHVHVGASTV